MLRALLLRLDRMIAVHKRGGIDTAGPPLGQDGQGRARSEEYREPVGSGRGHEHEAMPDNGVASVDRKEAGALGGLDVLAGDVEELADLLSATAGGTVAEDEEKRVVPASTSAAGAVAGEGHPGAHSLGFKAVHDRLGLADL